MIPGNDLLRLDLLQQSRAVNLGRDESLAFQLTQLLKLELIELSMHLRLVR